MKKINLLMILLFLSVIQVSAQWKQLTSPTQEGAEIRSFITAGSNVLGLSPGGIFRSGDNGLTWAYSMTGVNEFSNEVKNMCKLGTDVYMELGYSSNLNLYKSTNNGLSWSVVTATGLPSFANVDGLGSVNGKLIRLVSTYYPDNITEAYYSTNGTSWTKGGLVYYNPNNGNNANLKNLTNNRLYVVREDSIWYTTDGVSFTPISLSGLGSNIRFEADWNLNGEPNGSYFYYRDNNDLYRYNTASNNWTLLSNSLLAGAQIMGAVATDQVLMVNAVTFSPTISADLLRSKDHGNTWAKMPATTMMLPFLNSMHQTSGSHLIASGDLTNNLLYSNDTGTTWTKATGPYENSFDKIVAINNTLLATFGDGPLGVYRSTDDGQNWFNSNTGLSFPFGDTIFSMAQDLFKAGSNAFVFCGVDANNDSTQLYKSTNEGKNWTKVSTTPNYSAGIYMGKSNNTFFVKFTDDRRNWVDTNSFIYRSADFGATWQLVSSDFFTTYNFRKIYGFSGNGDTVLVLGQLKNGDDAIYLSADNGDNWSLIYNITANYYRIRTLNQNNAQPPVIASGGSGNHRALIAFEFMITNTDSLYFMDEQWAIKTLPYPLRITSIAYNNNHWYVGTSKGVFASRDMGKTWSKKSVTGLYPGMEIINMAFIGRKIFLGTSSNGVWQATHSVLELGSDKTVCNNNYVTLSGYTDGVDFTTWCCGLGTNPTVIFKPTATKTYTATGKDIFNLTTSDSVKVTVSNPQFLTNFSASPRLFSSPPFIAAFTNNTPNSTNYNFLWLFGDDSTSNKVDPIHQYFYNGTYTVTLIAIDKVSGCRDTFTRDDYVICSGGSTDPCLVQANISYSGTPLICEGDSFLLTASTGTGYNYQWTVNNIAILGANKYQHYAKEAGDYRVIVWDTSCSKISIPQSVSHYPYIKPIILSSGQLRPCSNDSMQLYIAEPYSSYKWSTGATTQSIWIKNSGSYFVTVTNSIGCKVRSNYFNINKSFLSVPEICIVTVDPTTKKNLIVWERPQSTLIKNYKIYKEGNQAGIYSLIGTQPYDSLSVFVDMGSNPDIKADRYRISLVDTCDVESGLSNPHMTIHLQANMGTMGEKNLVWNSYEGITFPSYKIYRGNSPSNVQLIGTIASSYRSFTDTSKLPGLYFYQILMLKGDTCYPAVKRAQTSSGPYSQSVSNMKDYSTATSNYLTVDPPELKLGPSAGSSAYIVVYTNLSTWDAYSSDPSWLDIVKSTSSGTIKVTAISSSTGRAGYVTIKGSGVDSQIVLVNQGTVGIQDDITPNSLAVYPNPYSGFTNIAYNLTKAGNVRLEVYNLVGEKITELYNGYQTAGSYTYQFSAAASGQPDGIYFVLFNLDNKTTVSKIVELK